MSSEQKSLKKYRSAYYWSVKFFPKTARDDMFKFYSFVQIVDDCTDVETANKKQFAYIEKRWKHIKKHLAKGHVPAKVEETPVEYALANIAYVVHRYRCDADWVDAFLFSKRWDLELHQNKSFKDMQQYMYGSSEVIGLFIARILNLPEEALQSARLQCRALQILDFLRNLQHDTAQGKMYFPLNEIKMHGLKTISYEEALAKPNMFTDFVQSQLLRYATWQTEANKGLYLIPKKLRVPMQTTVDAYNQTAQHIKNDPTIVFKHKVKLSKRNIIYRAVKNSVKKSN